MSVSWVNRAVWVVLAALASRGPAGQTVFDTKFDLTANPRGFLERSLTLWNAQGSLGELQNQAYGYLFPQGLVAGVGSAAGLSPWIVQRAWSALLLVVAYEGCRRVYLGLVGPRGASAPDQWLAMVAGLSYASAPRLAGLVSRLSSEVNPPALLPWALVAVLAVRNGRLSTRTGGLLAACAVLCMGGVNAVAVAACLPLVALFVCTVQRTQRRSLVVWLGVGLVGAVTWWVAPLFVLGRYSPPFLDFIETSADTSSPTGWFNVLRGADHWVAFFTSGDTAWWPGAHELHTSAPLVVTSCVVALAGVWGLMSPSMPLRRVLVVSVVLGFACLTLAHGGWAGSPLSGAVRGLLDGPLAMLRNVHKVDPLVRLPLALGAAHAVGRAVATVRVSSGGLTRFSPRLVVAAAVVTTVLVPLSFAPARPAGWSTQPQEWVEAARTVASSPGSPQAGALVLPAASFGQQTWGWTVDEPIQPFASSPWISRSQIPLTPPQSIRFLDALVARAESPLGSGTLADQLARAGIGWVVVRHDLDPTTSDPELARAVSSGLRRSAGLTAVDTTGDVEVFRVEGGVDVVTATAASSVRTVSGGPEDVLAAIENGLIDRAEPTLVAGDRAGLASATSASPAFVGDGNQRVERAFGMVRRATGPVLTPTERFVQQRPFHDYPGVEGSRLVEADYIDLAGVHVSSSGGSPFNLGEVRSDLGPQSAVDADPRTFWASLPYTNPREQWLELRLRRPQAVPVVEITANANPLEALGIRQVEVTTDRGDRVVVDVHPETGRATARLGGVAVSRVRVAVLKTAGDPSRGSVALREVAVPGLDLTRSLVVPDAAADADTTFVFGRDGESRACVRLTHGLDCEFERWRGSTESAGLLRDFSLAQPGTWTLSGRVRARSNEAAAALLDPLGPQVRATSESVLRRDPAVAPALAVDGSPDTFWLANPRDSRPAMKLAWGAERTIDSIVVTTPRRGATKPSRAILVAGSEQRVVTLGEGRAEFEPMRTRELTVYFDATESMKVDTAAPVGVAEVALGGLEDLVYAVDRENPTGAICGFGPLAVIDGVGYQTRVSGTLGDVMDGADLDLEVCGRSVDLVEGAHRLELRSTAAFEVVSAILRPGTQPSKVETRAVDVLRWGDVDRALEVAAGPTSLLRVAQNFNPGWSARLDGLVLRPIRVDGWQQGFVLPAGGAGEVVLRFDPNSAYRTGLLVGGVLAALLVAAAAGSALLDRRRRRSIQEPGSAAEEPRVAGQSVSARADTAVVAVAGAVLALVASPVAGAALWVWCALPRRRALLRWTTGSVLLSALAVAVWVAAGNSPARPPAAVDACVAALAGLMAGSLLRPDDAGEDS